MQGVYLPIPAATTGGGVGFRTVDHRSQSGSSAPAGTDGTCGVRFTGPENGRFWLVERIIVTCSSTLETTCRVYAGEPSPLSLVDSTPAGNDDVADETSAVLVESNRDLVIEWTGASNGAVGTAVIQYQLVERVSG